MHPRQAAFGKGSRVLDEIDFRLLLLATIFPILGNSLVSPILESLLPQFDATPANIGLMISVFSAPAIMVIPISGILADRYGRKSLLVGSLLIYGLSGVVIVATTDFELVLLLRFIQGIGFGGIVPVITTMIGDMYDGMEEMAGQGLRMMMNGVSGTVFPLIAGVLVMINWRFPFFLYALAVPVTVAIFVYFPETRQEDLKRSPNSGGWRYGRALWRQIRHPGIVGLLVGRALPIILWIGFLTYSSLVVIRILGGSVFQAGLLVAVGNLTFAISASQVGRISYHAGGRNVTLLAATICMAVGYPGFIFAPGITFALPAVVLLGAGFGISISIYRSNISAVSPPHLRGGMVSLGGALTRLLATLTPIAIGFIIQLTTPMWGEIAALQIAGVVMVVIASGGGLICLLLSVVFEPSRLNQSKSTHYE